MARRLEVEILGDASSLKRALGQAENSTSRTGKAFSKLGGYAKLAGVAVAGAVVVGLEKSVKAAMEAQVAEDRLTQSFKNAKVAIGPYRKEIEGLESSGRKLGFTDEKTIESLGSLITATHNMKMAAKDLAVAQDVARFKHVELTDATKMLTMAMTGSQRAAKQLGIIVIPVTKNVDALKASHEDLTTAIGKADLAQAKLLDKQATGIAVVDEVKKHVQGQADVYSKTFAGSLDQARAQIQHLEVAIGSALLPVMTRAVQYVMNNWPQISASIVGAWNQIKPTLVAFIDLARAVVNVIRANWGTIGPIVRGVAAVIKAQVQIITGAIRVLTAILRGDWAGAWNAAKATVSAAVALIVARVQLMKSLVVAAVRGVVAGVRGLAGAFFAAGATLASKLVHGIISGVAGLAGAIANALQSAISSAVHSVHVPTPHIHTSHGIPTGVEWRAMGGAVKAGQSYIVGERGPELFTPNGGGKITPNSRLGGMTIVHEHHYHGGVVQDRRFLDHLRRLDSQYGRANARPAF